MKRSHCIASFEQSYQEGPSIRCSPYTQFLNIKHVKIFGKSPGEVVVYPGIFQGKKSASNILINHRVSVQ